MRFLELEIPGAYLVEPAPIADERGQFARVWCAEEFASHGIGGAPVQANTGYNPARGTLRGLHYQAEPHPEAKLVRCTRGAVYDVLVDLRPGSPTYGRWQGAELTADNRHSLFIPPLCAHGYVTLVDHSELWYQATAAYAQDSARGLRYDDPALGIQWPVPIAVISERDRSWPWFETRQEGA
jgi:dTDP-4-dehydrorhamnose 3,5-epimerase